MDPKEQAQLQAEVAMTGFILWTKRVVAYSLIFLCVVMFACNNGVETGPNATGSGYNGEQYSPSNLNVKKK
tara:strand:+ start:3897 stop:4109 length:213 start_codon:yes stop_codon:yes gene_type:complete